MNLESAFGTKKNQKIRNLYGKQNLVMHDDIDTYFGVDLETHLNESHQLIKSWIKKWGKSIYDSIKQAKGNAKRDTYPICKSLNLNKSPHFFVR